MRRSSGSWMSARARATLWRIPPESRAGKKREKAPRPSSSRIARGLSPRLPPRSREEEGKLHVGRHRLPWKQAVVLEDHRPAQGRAFAPAEDYPPLGRIAQPREDPDDARLAAARGTDDGGDRAFPYFRVQAFEGRYRALGPGVFEAQVLQPQARGASALPAHHPADAVAMGRPSTRELGLISFARRPLAFIHERTAAMSASEGRRGFL